MNKVLMMSIIVAASTTVMAGETLPVITDGQAPKTFEAMWEGFDPRAEPLDVEVLKEWEEDGVVLKVLRYRIGMFKGQKAMMAAVYGYPKDGRNLPGLVQIHGGGQYANYNACLTNGKRGYATLSISWAGRISARDYTVDPSVVKLFWEGETNDPNYKVTTDWGALDGYHAPARNPGNNFPSAQPAAWTLDAMESPRNSPWFLCALGARRGLTFLERQPEVDGEKLGVYGHSMGGKLTVMTAGADQRVKAAAPSCGGISDRDNTSALFRATVGDDPSLKHISCPIIFLSPANDFHGQIDDLPTSIEEIKSTDWRVTCSPHHNHQDTAEYEVATQLWFDQYLKDSFVVPNTPMTAVDMKTSSGVPSLMVTADASKPILYVDVFYTQQGQTDGLKDDRENTMNRFWCHAATKPTGVASWRADLPLFSTDKPLWVYANVVYALDKPISGAGYYYGNYEADKFNLSSLVKLVSAADLKAAGVKATLKASLIIETFEDGWKKEWFSYRPGDWTLTTHKVYDPRWRAPASATLALDVRCEKANTIIVGLDTQAAEAALKGGSEWQTVTFAPSDFNNADGEALADWSGLKALRFASREVLRSSNKQTKPVHLGARWNGAAPEFRNLSWVVK
jgi:cephalosporin-C deacetylase-like acetyl esterase